MKIKIRPNLCNPGIPLKGLQHFTGSALPIEIPDAPAWRAGRKVTGVIVTVTNADGVECVAECDSGATGWTCLFSAACFANYGFVSGGVKVDLVMGGDSETVAMGDIDIMRAAASASPGVPDSFVAQKGGDIYCKTRVVDGVQHYAKQTISFDAEMGAYGAEWSGDYILDASGNFVDVTNED